MIEAEQNEEQSIFRKERESLRGAVIGLFACALAVAGLFYYSHILVPLSAVAALVGTLIAIKDKAWIGFAINVLAWGLVVYCLFAMPALLEMLGLTTGSA